jgi:hypothetical protein
MANENGNTFALLDRQLRRFNGPDLFSHELIHHLLKSLCLELHNVREEHGFGILLFYHNFFACCHHTKDLSKMDSDIQLDCQLFVDLTVYLHRLLLQGSFNPDLQFTIQEAKNQIHR